MNTTKKGFTLIELLVVVAIIGLLSSVVLASLNVARIKARDSVRKSDIQQIRTALEFYYSVNGSYPAETACDTSRGSSASTCPPTGTTWTTTSSIYVALVPTYMPTLPVDPVNNTSYFYTYEPAGTVNQSYCIGAALEGGGRYYLTAGAAPLSTC